MTRTSWTTSFLLLRFKVGHPRKALFRQSLDVVIVSESIEDETSEEQ